MLSPGHPVLLDQIVHCATPELERLTEETTCTFQVQVTVCSGEGEGEGEEIGLLRQEFMENHWEEEIVSARGKEMEGNCSNSLSF